MCKQEYISIIYKQTMTPQGFLSKLRENSLDESGYKQLLDAIKSLIPFYIKENKMDKLLVACLYEVPWEVENCINHYSQQDKKLGDMVSNMSENLRSAINDLLWSGLEKYYEDI
ncbi:hypothetical protein [Zooshikella ganghwensis]|uniref:hypothetical protein n=1 Tax=Zooshikella ganghwensis TaxID=202772 RepID=UPI00040A27CE|nr:hypothetical protein [Zooshikella ganghwensis]